MAVFVKRGTRFPVAVTKAGRGTVTSSPAAIDCGSRCSGTFAAGGTATLSAVPKKGWAFVRWSGSCAGKRKTCPLEMDGPKSVSATFGRAADPVPPRVTALKSTGAPGAIARLRYRVVEASGRSSEVARILRAGRVVAVVWGKAHDVSPDVLFYFISWRVPPSLGPGNLRFCVVSTDPAGNTSKPGCAPLRIT
jgi:hypothetical protein